MHLSGHSPNTRTYFATPKDVWPKPPPRTKLFAMSISRMILITALLTASTHLPAQTCLSGMPESLRSVVEQDKWTIVQPQDLSESDLILWKTDHPGQCPGVAAGNPSAKADQYFIVALIHPDGPKNLLEKVVMVTRKNNRPITQEAVSMWAVATPRVVWLQKNRYPGIDFTTSRDSFVFERVSATASQTARQASLIKPLLPLETGAVTSTPLQPATKCLDDTEALLTNPIY